MRNYKMMTWADLDGYGCGELSPIAGLDAITLVQAAEWMRTDIRKIQAPKQRCYLDLCKLGLFVDVGKNIVAKTRNPAKVYYLNNYASYRVQLENGDTANIPLSRITYLPAPAVARLADEVGLEYFGTINKEPGIVELPDDAFGLILQDDNPQIELEVKTVPFMGSDLVAVRDENGQIWAGVRWMCEGIGLSEGQTKAERAKIQTDKVFLGSGRNFVLNKNGYGNREILCLKLDFVPIWLAKISITPAMERENPELADRLLQYQLRAKDVLAEAFLGKPNGTGLAAVGSTRVAVLENKIDSICAEVMAIERRFDGLYDNVTDISTRIGDVRKSVKRVETMASHSNYYLRMQMRSGYNQKWTGRQSKNLKAAAEFLKVDEYRLLSEIYKEMEQQYGICLEDFCTDYKRVKKIDTCSTLSVVSTSISLRQMFDNILGKVLTDCHIQPARDEEDSPLFQIVRNAVNEHQNQGQAV